MMNIVVSHLMKGNSGRFEKTIFYVLQAVKEKSYNVVANRDG